MKSTTFALTALASLAHVMANGWNNVTETKPPYTETTWLPENRTDTIPPNTVTTRLPDDRTDTIPPITTVTTHTGYTTYCPESTVLTITVCDNGMCAPQVFTVPESSTLTINEDCIFPTTYEEKEARESVTGHITYFPKPAIATISTCSGTECAPHEYTVSEPTTWTVNEAVTLKTVRSGVSSVASSSTIAAVSTYEAGAARAAAGFAGLVGIALLI